MQDRRLDKIAGAFIPVRIDICSRFRYDKAFCNQTRILDESRTVFLQKTDRIIGFLKRGHPGGRFIKGINDAHFLTQAFSPSSGGDVGKLTFRVYNENTAFVMDQIGKDSGYSFACPRACYGAYVRIVYQTDDMIANCSQ